MHIYMCKYLHFHPLHTTHPPPLRHSPGVVHKRFPSTLYFQFLQLVVWYISLLIHSAQSTEWRTSNQVWSSTFIYVNKICIIIICMYNYQSSQTQQYIYMYDHLKLFFQHLYLLQLPKNVSILVPHYGVKVFLQNRSP